MDKIVISGLRVKANHGVNPEEKEFGQWFIVDVEASLDLSRPCFSDRIGDTVSYAQVIKRISSAMTERTFSLIEAAAQYCVDSLMSDFPQISFVKFTLKKPDAPIDALFDYVAVEIERARI